MQNNTENIVNGKESNKKFIEAIIARRTKLFEDAKPFAESSNAADVVEKIDDENFVKKEDKEEYDILMTLMSYLDFEKEPAENTYEFRGLEYQNGNNSYRTTIYLSKENALKVSKLANDYEDKLRRSNNNPDDLKMSIKFPVELLLLKYKGTNMPGLDYEAPEPKTAAQSIKEYETGLEQYYSQHNINKEFDEMAEFRKSYPHERINCHQVPPTMSNIVQNGYYEDTVRELAGRNMNAEHGEPGLEPDQEEPIVGTDRPLGRRIGDGLLNIKNIFKSDTIFEKVTKGLIIAGLGYTAVSCLIASPGVTLMLAAGITAVGATAAYISPKIKKGLKAVKKKLKEWLFGPELTNEPEQEPETMTPEQITARTEEIQREIQAIDADIARLTEEMNNLPEGSPERAAKEAEIAAKNREKRAKLAEVSALLHNYDAEHSRGGLGR